MKPVLITSGPTRQYIDPVRYLTNASSGRMGAALAAAVLECDIPVVVVSGPVEVAYPSEAIVHGVTSTEEMLAVAEEHFHGCQGAIGVAAPCDYRPIVVSEEKIQKTGGPLHLQLEETPDVVASLGKIKQDRWLVGFALETTDHRLRALGKMQRKCCDLMAVNGVDVMNSTFTQVEILAPDGRVLSHIVGDKRQAAREMFRTIRERLIP